MSLWSWLFGGKKATGKGLESSDPVEPVREAKSETVRRWDAAQTHRLNTSHWSSARQGQHINDDLAGSLRVLQARCTYEASANPWVEGVITTHSIDLVTPSGPTLVVESSNDTFNQAFKDAWDKWWASPELAGELSGVDLLRRWNRAFWTKGPIIGQFVSDPDVTSDDVVALRIRDIDPTRLETPAANIGYESTQFGIQRSKKTGRPAKFFVRKDNARTTQRYTGGYEEITAEDALFAFISYEADQATGFPGWPRASKRSLNFATTTPKSWTRLGSLPTTR